MAGIGPGQPGKWGSWARAAIAATLLATLALTPACRRYPQDSPDALIASARQMVERGHADRLPDLIYAESKEMRQLLDKLGQTFGTLQTLAREVQTAFPDDIAAYRQQAEDAAKRGEASNFLQRFAGQAMGGAGGRTRGRGGRDARQAEEARAGFDLLMKELFADPYGWIASSEGRLSARPVTDDTAALLWDDKPILGIGLLLREEGGKWYVVLPTNFPGAGRLLPKSPEAWEVIGGLVEVFDKTLQDLTDDVRAGRVKRLDDLARSAGEKAFLPAALVFLAYEKVREAEKKAGSP